MTPQVVIQQYSAVRHQQRCCALSECSCRSPAHSSAPQTQSTTWSHVSSTPHTPATSKLGPQQSSATLRGGWDPDTVHVFLEIPHSLVNLRRKICASRVGFTLHLPSSGNFACRQPYVILLGCPTDFAKPLAALGNPWWRSRHGVPACILLRRGLSLDIGFTMHHTHYQRHPSCALPTAGLPTGTRYTDLSLLCWSTDITSSTKTAVHRPLRNSEVVSPSAHKLVKPTSLAFPKPLLEAIAPRHQRLIFFCRTQTLTPSKFKIVAMPPQTDLPDLEHNHPPLSLPLPKGLKRRRWNGHQRTSE